VKQRYTDSRKAGQAAKVEKERRSMALVTLAARWVSARDSMLRVTRASRELVGGCSSRLPVLSQGDPAAEVREAGLLAAGALATLGSRLGASGLDESDDAQLLSKANAASEMHSSSPQGERDHRGNDTTGDGRDQGTSPDREGGSHTIPSPRVRQPSLYRSYSRGYIGSALETYQ